MIRRIAQFILVIVILVLAAPGATPASTHDLTVDQFFLPGTNTSGYRVHTSTTRAHMNITIPRGNIWAVGGYKALARFTHPATASQSSANIALSGTAVTQQRFGYEGSVLGVSVVSSSALTAGTATAVPTIRNLGTVRATGLTAAIGTGPTAGHTQFFSRTQARGRDVFGASDEVGCQLTTTSDIAPVGANILCTVIVEF